MSTKGKKIFLLLTVVLPFLAYCYFYYQPILKNAPFRSDEFVSFQYKWGVGAELANSYDSATGEYQYLNKKDSLVRTNVKLRQNDIIYLHNKANELGFWNFPDVIANAGTTVKNSKVLRYEFVFNYKRKTKKVVYLTDYSDIPKLSTVAGQMKTLVQQTIDDAEERYSKK
jgi:ribonuclease BN (tRNA processing enzyme)